MSVQLSMFEPTAGQKPKYPDPTAYSQRLVLAVLVAAAAKGERLTSRQIGERTANIPTNVRTSGGVLRYAFPISDPRKTISNLRRLGYNITDEWETNAMGKGYKRYWLADPSQVEEETDSEQ